MLKKITISGHICTGKTTLFSDLDKTLGWTVFSAGHFFREYAKKQKISIENADEQNEKLTKEVDFKMQSMLKEKDNILLEGWMTGIMAHGIPGVLKILLICNEEERVQRFMKREHVSRDEAIIDIRDREGNWENKLRKIYNRNDFFDPKNYDLVIDTTNKKSDEVLHIVLQALGYFAVNGQPKEE